MKTHKHSNKLFVKIAVLALSVLMAIGAVACGGGSKGSGGGNQEGSKVNASIYISKGGFGTSAHEAQVARFNEAFKDKEYTDANGNTLKGVNFKVMNTGGVESPSLGSVKTNDAHLIFYAHTQSQTVAAAYGQQAIVDLTDVMTAQIPGDPEGSTIVNKIPDQVLPSYTNGATGSSVKYAAIPWGDSTYGVVYDIERWENEGLYLVKDGGTQFRSAILPNGVGYYFGTANKTVGPNGVPGDYDDGLPSSMYELIVLCEKLKKSGTQTPPFIYPGEYPQHTNFLAEALTYSLLGKENAAALWNFTSDEFNVITSFTQDDLFNSSVSRTIKVPEVTTVAVEEGSGYYTTTSVEKYWAMAFLQLAKQQNWFGGTVGNTLSHTATQRAFINSQFESGAENRGAMLLDGSFWYNESIDAGNWTDYEVEYYMQNGEFTTPDSRKVAWMPLPINIMTSVTGEKNADGSTKYVEIYGGVKENVTGEKPVRVSSNGGALVVNNFFANKPEMIEAAKDYLKFICSDEELSKFAAAAGYSLQLDFTLDTEVFATAPKYSVDTFELIANSDRVFPSSDKATYLNRELFPFAISYSSWHFNTAMNQDGGAIGVLNSYNGDVIKAFEALMAHTYNTGVPTGYDTARSWWKLWSRPVGQDDLPPLVAKYPVGHPKQGEDVVYTKYVAQ